MSNSASTNATQPGSGDAGAGDGGTKRGLKIPPQGVGGFDRLWYPVCLSSDVAPGQVIGRELMNGRVVVYRGASGAPYVLSAFCRHLGADLAVGTVIGEHIRCAFHHWSYDGGGQCVKIAAGDKPPQDAKLFKFPTRESLGLIWAFNGTEPDMELPSFTIPESELVVSAIHNKDMNVDCYMVFSNSMDFQHLKVIHGVELIGELKEMSVTDRTMEYLQEMKVPGMGRMNQRVRVWGTNSIALEGETMGRPTYQMAVGTPLPGNRARIWNVNCTPKPSGKPGEQQMIPQLIKIMEEFGRRLIEEDAPVHNTMSFRHDRMAESDKYLSLYLRFARKYPRANPADDMIAP
jgi:phenylpropionate dioxygenase-like ring-hydroxylating dioxygenase large terminal subunit